MEENVRSIVLVHAAIPPVDGWRRYQSPDPRTRREDGLVEVRERWLVVLEVLRKGSLENIEHGNQIRVMYISSDCAFSSTYHQNSIFKIPLPSPNTTSTLLSECFSPPASSVVAGNPGSAKFDIAKNNDLVMESPMKRMEGRGLKGVVGKHVDSEDGEIGVWIQPGGESCVALAST
jgi:hypothetical protein